MHGRSQGLHGLTIGLPEERQTIDVDQLIILQEAAVPGCCPTMDHILDKYS